MKKTLNDNYNGLIRINSVDKAKDFVNRTRNIDCDIDLKSGRYLIDAKSIMGIFSMDLSNQIELIAYTDDTNVIKKLDEIVKDFSA